MRTIRFITHPDVVIAPAVPVPEWGLSERGLARMRGFAAQGWRPGAVWASTERKAMQAAAILSDRFETLAALGENDRSATGYTPLAEFEAAADTFFARPDESFRGWERAVDAQARIVAGVAEVIARSTETADIAIVAHGAVGALYICHLTGAAISRASDQPAGAGGNHFAFDATGLVHGWRSIDG